MQGKKNKGKLAELKELKDVVPSLVYTPDLYKTAMDHAERSRKDAMDDTVTKTLPKVVRTKLDQLIKRSMNIANVASRVLIDHG